MSYGIPYKGSKQGIAYSLMMLFPECENFYDLFGGGGAITHCAFESKKFKNIYYNEIDKAVFDFFKGVVSGNYSKENFTPKWITRKEFESCRDLDGYISIIWSFGNGRKSYLFGKDIEKSKEALHNAVVFGKYSAIANDILQGEKLSGKTINSRRLQCRSIVVKQLREGQGNKEQLQQLQQLQQLERLKELTDLQQLQRIERLHGVQNLHRIHFSSVSYEKVKIKNNSLVYCDPPYRGTSGYKGGFDNDIFEEWASSAKFPVFISEYKIEHKGLFLIFKIGKTVTMSASGGSFRNEFLYGNKEAVKMLRKNKELSMLVHHIKL